MDLTQGLNTQQLDAVTAEPGPVLVLAGPGSGKTRVLTHRIAYLIGIQEVKPYDIIAVTFTNKAAAEMRSRVEALLGGRLRGARLGTFHANCARILRQEAEHLPYDANYLIYDSDDQRSLIKAVVEELGVDLKRLRMSLYQLLNRISDAKNELVLPSQYPRSEYLDEIIARVYERYQERLVESNAMDFDDLIMQTVLLLRQNLAVREQYQRYFQHVLVDEFQDTNIAQYELVRLWAAPHNNAFVVGDEDQAIYGFRGADYRNVLRFRKDYPGAKVVLLEQNYRSTQTVLDAARAVIDRNQDRTPKALFTDRGLGVKITAFESYNEIDEAEYITREVERLRARHDYQFDDIAVMYRTNAQSRILEKICRDNRIPYRLVGGLSFYSRREIKDMLAYLRVINSDTDEVSFNRIVNTPTRGIGNKTLGAFQKWADANNLSNGAAMLHLLDGEQTVESLSGGSNKKLVKFAEMLAAWRKLADQGNFGELLDDILERTRYDDHLAKTSKTDEELFERRGNIQELRTDLETTDAETLTEYLTNTALLTDVRTDTAPEDAITLLTLHASKGLEFPVVFITGLEDGLLPHSRSIDAPEGMAEERRLLYVGITRARDILFLTRAFNRRSGAYNEPSGPSRFLFDLPRHLIEGLDGGTKSSHNVQSYYRSTVWDMVPSPQQSAPDEKIIPFPGTEPEPQFKTGVRVMHGRFGEGIVVESRTSGTDEEVTVAFETHGIKRLMASFANLQILKG